VYKISIYFWWLTKWNSNFAIFRSLSAHLLTILNFLQSPLRPHLVIHPHFLANTPTMVSMNPDSC
jgi:hypothetical protein